MKRKKLFRELVYFMIRMTQVPNVHRWLVQKNTVTILVYHNLGYKSAEVLFNALKKRYNFISLHEYIDRLYGNDSREIPPRAIIVTLDDGYKENYHLLPLAIKYHIKPTIFLCSSVVDTDSKLWFNSIHKRNVKEKLKRLPEEERVRKVDELIQEFFDEDMERTFLNREEMLEMSSYVDFQSHTVTHPILAHCSDQRSMEEIAESKRDLEKKYGFDIKALAFPNGSYREREIINLKNAGYKCGLTLKTRLNTLKSDPFRLSRIPLNDDAGINEIIVKASGVYDLYLKKIFPKRRD